MGLERFLFVWTPLLVQISEVPAINDAGLRELTDER